MKVKFQFDNEFVTIDIPDDADFTLFLEEEYNSRVAEADEDEKDDVTRYESITDWAKAVSTDSYNAFRRHYAHAAPTAMPKRMDGVAGTTMVDEDEKDETVPFNSIEFYGDWSCVEKTDQELREEELKNQIRETLKEEQAAAIIMRYFDGMQVKEIAEELNKTPDAVTKLLRRGEKNIYKKLIKTGKYKPDLSFLKPTSKKI